MDRCCVNGVVGRVDLRAYVHVGVGESHCITIPGRPFALLRDVPFAIHTYLRPLHGVHVVRRTMLFFVGIIICISI